MYLLHMKIILSRNMQLSKYFQKYRDNNIDFVCYDCQEQVLITSNIYFLRKK